MDDETARLNGGPSSSLSLDVELAASQTRRRHPDCVTLLAVGAIAGLLAAVAAALIAAAVIRPPLPGYRLSEQPLGPGSTELHTPDIVSRVAFGSCVAYDSATPQDVWTEGVLPSKPDAWLWLGDMAYMDVPPFDCNLEENAAAPACSCPPDHLKTPPFNCLAGDLDNARTKMQAQVRNANYTAFLDHMCPGAARAESPPQGDDPSACPKPILGIYDDHDSFSNNYDRRGPLKHLMKQVYLDGLGEAADSARRGALRGIEFHYRLNAGHRGKEIDVIMLDGRWDRAPLPCEVRRDWCERIVLPSNSTAALRKHPWCEDFLTTGGLAGAGSCCKADEAIFWGWCLELGSKSDPLWRIACDPSFPGFASQPLVLHDGALHPPGPSVQDAEEDGSPICEVLGRRQREWLEDVLTTRATAPLKIIASGSVLLGDPVTINEDTTDWEGQCSGDDWDCYRPAQLALLSALQRGAAAAGGCVVVAAGDFHFSDIRAAFPGGKTPANYPPSSSDSAAQGAAWQQGYSDVYATDGWTTPIYQVLASGLTNSTAKPMAPCEGWRRDPAGLRPFGPCGYVKQPAFGSVEVDWEARRARLQVRGAVGGGPVLQELTISLDTCLPV